MDKPFISVVMLSYNNIKFIEDALMSVINQRSNHYDLEILLIDDGSNDGTQEIVKKIHKEYPAILFPFFKKHQGVTAINKNLNELIKKARGNYIAFLAGDDKYLPNRFYKQLDIFHKYKDVELIIGEGIDFDIKKNKYLRLAQDKSIIYALKKNDLNFVYEYLVSNIPALYIQGYLVKKNLLEKIGYFDENVIADDWVFNIKMFDYLRKSNKKAAYISNIVFQRNIHTNNTSFDFKNHYLRIVQVVDKYIPQEFKKEIIKQMYFYFFVKSVTVKKNFLESLKFFTYYIYHDPYGKLFIKKFLSKFKIYLIRKNLLN